ncbi:hypothetical protein AR685_15235 [Chryseobacterium sp. JAH]|nr:hypothetical protein AR685_15235 [Chryseobacterium sp. JAH]
MELQKRIATTLNNSAQKTSYKKKDTLKIKEEKPQEISIQVIKKIPNSLQSFVGSCGTESAIVYNTRKIEILNQNIIAVYFDTEQIIQEEIENSSSDYLLFKYNEDGNLLLVTDKTEKKDILANLPFSLSERIHDFGSRMYVTLLHEKRIKNP